MPLLEVESLSSGYKGVPVVHDVGLAVEEGEIVAVLGANGAGKTTMLLTISGFLKPLGGRIRFVGESIVGNPPDQIGRRGLIQVAEDRSLFRQLTVAENLRVAARSKHDLERAANYFPPLLALMKRQAGVLSGGEQQMLALARGIAGRPRLLMVDEMSLGLAPQIVQSLFPVLRQIVSDSGCAVLMVEQHVHLALAVADRAYVMERGRIVSSGPAGEVRGSLDQLTGSYLGHTGGQRSDGKTASGVNG